MGMSDKLGDVALVMPWFEDHLVLNGGFILANRACMACFYYYRIAEKAKQKAETAIENQIQEYEVGASIMDMPLWAQKHYRKQAEAVATLYSLESIEEMFAYWPQVRSEAFRLNWPTPKEEYMSPPVDDSRLNS